jgi:predicted RNA polymerase sigma factor
VQRALYLLFNEGYHGASSESPVRAELCAEAMRLTSLLVDHPFTATPSTHALYALMCLNAARLPARVDSDGNLTTLYVQDRSQWNRKLLTKGLRLMESSAAGSELSEYHVEAAIAAVHAGASGVGETDWASIVALYDTLMSIRQTPVVALNRAIAVAQHEGPERGLEEIRAIPDRARLANYPFYQAALGELELRAGNAQVARAYFEGARSLARNPMERTFMQQRIDACEPSRKN